MEVRACALTITADFANLLAGLYGISLLCENAIIVHMAVKAIDSLSVNLMTYDDPVTEAFGWSCGNYLSVSRSKDWFVERAARMGDIHASVIRSSGSFEAASDISISCCRV